MKELEITAKSKEEAVNKAVKKYGIPKESMNFTVVEDTTSDMLEGAAPLELRVKIQINPDFLIDLARKKIARLLELMGIEGEIRSNLDGNIIKVKLHVNNPAVLIGQRGENLDAVQHIINRMINRGERELPIVIIDVQNFRERRFQEIDNLVKRAVFSVLKYKKKFVLPVMSSEERKLIHNKVKEFKGVVSYSQGRDDERAVVVDLAANAPVKENIRKKE